MGLPGGYVEAFAFLEKYGKKLYGKTRTEQLTNDVLNEKIELHKQGMTTVENMPEDIPFHAHTNERMAHRADLQ